MTLTIGPIAIHSYTALIALAVMAFATRWLWSVAPSARGQHADVLLIALASAIVAGRASHVVLHWAHFAYYPDEIWRPQAGGLEWHGAFLGAWAGLTIGARWRGIPQVRSDMLAPALPLIACAAWCGCAVASCAYGAEVPTLATYPSYLVWESTDVYGIPSPRFNVQGLGAVLSALLWMLMCFLGWRGLFPARRLALSLLFFSALMLALGFLRADYIPRFANLRADQWLDVLFILTSAFSIFYKTRRLKLEKSFIKSSQK